MDPYPDSTHELDHGRFSHLDPFCMINEGGESRFIFNMGKDFKHDERE